MCNQLRAAFASILLSFASICDASAGENAFGPFTVDDTKPDVITLNGEIDVNAGLNFRRALQAAPGAKLITLNSLGGNVQMGLLIADDIHQRKLATYIPSDSKCFSACAFVFLAGAERKVDGALGVHQISSGSSDLVGAQLAISDIIEVLNRFGTPMDVMHVMFKTPPDDMHVFSQDEIGRYGLNRTASQRSEESAASREEPLTTTQPVHGDESSGKQEVTSDQPTADSLQAGLPRDTARSPIEEFTKRPNRVAIYTGLDLFGADISSVRVEDAAECAKSCLVMEGQCKAFTFNTNPRLRNGPNCFLKSSAGRADGNSVAFSGRFLSGAEADPSAFSMGVIDPQTALFDNVDLPGGDLSRRPHQSAKTPLACRMACVDEALCIAFTYIKTKRECWLKGAIGSPVFGKEMVSGLKKIETFSPAKIISLD
jgi:hypothetical protein